MNYLGLLRQCFLWLLFIPSHSAAVGLLTPGWASSSAWPGDIFGLLVASLGPGNTGDCGGDEVLGRFAEDGGMVSISSCLGGSVSREMGGLVRYSGSMWDFFSMDFVALK